MFIRLKCKLADEPKPWVSEPQGITFDYFNGRPLGMVVAAIRVEATVYANGHGLLDSR